MHILTDAFIAILSGYLAFTTIVANNIMLLMAGQQSENDFPVAAEAYAIDTEQPLQVLPSTYERGGAIPRILIENRAYQNAAVIASSNGQLPGETSSVIDALVNIYCTHKNGRVTRTNTGSGFFISPAGVIMTNAHVAQFLLLGAVAAAGETTCVVRAGDPAEPLYEAKLLYISPAWIVRNAYLIDSQSPKGTGERDYALLYIDKGLNNKPLPGRFPYLALDTSLMSTRLIGATVSAGGYPADHIMTEGPDSALHPQVATATLMEMYTFGTNYADVFSIADSIIGEHGASGGPVLGPDGTVIGLISTKGSSEDGAHSLRAITLSYIDRAITQESNANLTQMLSGPLALRAKLFTDTIGPLLSELLAGEMTP